MRAGELARVLHGVNGDFQTDITDVSIDFQAKVVRLYSNPVKELKPYIDHS